MLLVTAVLLCVSTFVAQGASPGYYWRDFDGSIPPDAYAGGIDINSRPIYIAQVYDRFLIPAKLYYNDNTAYYEYGGKEYGVKQNIKILCTEHPELFEWISTSNEAINSITGKYLVKGGYEPGCTTYIGRIRKDGEVLVGKALADNLPVHAGLYVTKNQATHHSTKFEVLSFNLDTTNDIV
ncbi:hypothetical protein PPYR_05477 [Photinus pyralis]|uniref:Uncharacterized protein n=2 Tax=Photinus pyralis TaxID=7054 RepID=A0A5N4AV35_PHOPY|nr:uncharacterized protein LOC116166134 [Photinus pyralis]XP_031356568.1 uncharacterized protein LOC116180625 [Photinus pyralis]XP_031356569.1 uncharacterized protein LOC116180626 [Photinus pyralis]XP_031357621.1 uncharacterized protein LOC116181398 [Photinus pyralis]KAB0801123.1 hypothetical protein PPYR_05477 [Photinus pyralis]